MDELLVPGRFTALYIVKSKIILSEAGKSTSIVIVDVRTRSQVRSREWCGSPRDVSICGNGEILVVDCRWCPDYFRTMLWPHSKEGIGCLRKMTTVRRRVRTLGVRYGAAIKEMARGLFLVYKGSLNSISQMKWTECGLLSWPTSILAEYFGEGRHLITESRRVSEFNASVSRVRHVSAPKFLNLVGVQKWLGPRVLLLEAAIQNDGAGVIWEYNPFDDIRTLFLGPLANPGGMLAIPERKVVYISESTSKGCIWKVDADTGKTEIFRQGLHWPTKISRLDESSIVYLTRDGVFRGQE